MRTVLAEQTHVIRTQAHDGTGHPHVLDDLCTECLARALRNMRLGRLDTPKGTTYVTLPGEPAFHDEQWGMLTRLPDVGDGPGVLVSVLMQLCEACDTRFGDPCRCQPNEVQS